jgi:ornithine racemase
MTAPRLEIDLAKLHHNARTLVDRLGGRGVAVTAVTKGTLGSTAVALELLRAGVRGLGDSRMENIEALRDAGVTAPVTLIRSPMPSQVDRVVAHADVSVNTEMAVLRLLSAAASDQGRIHGVVLMVELGDLREGILPGDLLGVVRQLRELPALRLAGIGANLACQNGVAPDARNMGELSDLVDAVERATGDPVDLVSGGNSANLEWAFGATDLGRVNELRLGEAILLGREALQRRRVDRLYTDVFTLVGEVIEAQVKPSLPWGDIGQNAFGVAPPVRDRGPVQQAILALGVQDVDVAGIQPPTGIDILGASSDHLVLDTGHRPLAVGDEVRFQVDYGGLLRAMTSPFVAKVPLAGMGADLDSALGTPTTLRR